MLQIHSVFQFLNNNILVCYIVVHKIGTLVFFRYNFSKYDRFNKKCVTLFVIILACREILMYLINILCKAYTIVKMLLRIVAHDVQPANSQKSTVQNNTWQNVSNKKCSYLIFKLSSPCSHTSLKSFLPPINYFVDDALIQLIPFIHNALS